MKSTLEIEVRIRELLSKEYQERCRVYSRRLPHRCQHNIRHTLDTSKYVYGEENPNFNRITREHHLPVLNTMGLCGLHFDEKGQPMPPDGSGEWNGDVICDDEVMAKSCPYYTPKRLPQMVYDDYIRDLQDTPWVLANLPGAYELLWVLESTKVQMSKWQILWFKLKARFLRLEPYQPATRLSLVPYAPKLQT